MCIPAELDRLWSRLSVQVRVGPVGAVLAGKIVLLALPVMGVVPDSVGKTVFAL